MKLLGTSNRAVLIHDLRATGMFLSHCCGYIYHSSSTGWKTGQHNTADIGKAEETHKEKKANFPHLLSPSNTPQFRRVDPASLASPTTIVFIKICNTERRWFAKSSRAGRQKEEQILSKVNTRLIFMITNLALLAGRRHPAQDSRGSAIPPPEAGRSPVARKWDPGTTLRDDVRWTSQTLRP